MGEQGAGILPQLFHHLVSLNLFQDRVSDLYVNCFAGDSDIPYRMFVRFIYKLVVAFLLSATVPFFNHVLPVNAYDGM